MFVKVIILATRIGEREVINVIGDFNGEVKLSSTLLQNLSQMSRIDRASRIKTLIQDQVENFKTLNKENNLENEDQNQSEDEIEEIPLLTKTELEQNEILPDKKEIPNPYTIEQDKRIPEVNEQNPGYIAKWVPKITCEFCYKVRLLDNKIRFLM